jgi:hypothetical protein
VQAPLERQPSGVHFAMLIGKASGQSHEKDPHPVLEQFEPLATNAK